MGAQVTLPRASVTEARQPHKLKGVVQFHGSATNTEEREAEARWLLSNARGQRYEYNREWFERCERWLSK